MYLWVFWSVVGALRPLFAVFVVVFGAGNVMRLWVAYLVHLSQILLSYSDYTILFIFQSALFTTESCVLPVISLSLCLWLDCVYGYTVGIHCVYTEHVYNRS